ncbi:hypothetical protein AB0D94_12820 [Streptomyces sp. NPDC048255]|uniref:hypothetical protein n=1 Tax=Streptomyces sp. NPDC048255 TaxID=3154713 RepID=UPI0033F3CC74
MTTRAVHETYATRPSASGRGAWRLVLGAVALAATVPYLALKTAWLAGSRVGIPAGSVLNEPGLFFTVANSVTLAMDACVLLLVLVLTRPWGIRVPSPLLSVPVFVATGLLTPILTGFPGQLLIRALGGGPDPAVEAAREPFLDPWVFTVVYAGFTVQGLALAGLFVPYARERWGGRWRGVLGERQASPTGVVAAAAAVAGTMVAAVYLYWAFGGTAGVNAAQVAQWSPEAGLVSAIHAAGALAAGAGALFLARGGRRRARGPVAVAWTGSAMAASWGLYLLIASSGGKFEEATETTTVMYLTYAGQMVTGLLAATVLSRYLTSRRPV